MKQYIFKNKNGGWYIFGTNYKDKTDVAYLDLYFPQNSEPKTMNNKVIIDIQEAKFTSYKNKIGLTVFKYEQLTDIDLESVYNNQTQELDTSKFGGEIKVNDVKIEQDELPFY